MDKETQEALALFQNATAEVRRYVLDILSNSEQSHGSPAKPPEKDQ